MKRICLLLIFILSVTCTACSSQKSSPIEDFTYELIDGEVTITGYTGSDLDIVVPENIDNRPVTTIGEDAFMKYDMNSIILPKTLKTIEKNAFRSCKKLKEITIPDEVTEVKGEYTFDECESLETIHLPDSIQRFDDYLIDSPWYENQEEGVLYIDNVCVGYKGIDYPASLAIKDGTKSIVRLFSGYVCNVPGSERNERMNFLDIYIPDTVKYIAPESVGYYTEEIYYYGVKSGHYANHDFTIHGKAGSYAENYANENEMIFMDLDSANVDISGKYSFVGIENDEDAANLKELGIYPKGDLILTINGSEAVMEIVAEDSSYKMTVNKQTQTMSREDMNVTYSYRMEGNDLIVCDDGVIYAEYRYKKQ